MSKDSWNAQRGCFEPIMDQIHSPSVRKQEAPMSIGTLDTALNYEKVTTPLPSPVANQTTSLNLAAFYHSIDNLRSLTEVMSAQLAALPTCARGQEHQCLVTLRGQERDLASMSLSLASLIYSASSNREAQTGSVNQPSPSTSHIGSTPEG
jgi:hypothetical protein